MSTMAKLQKLKYGIKHKNNLELTIHFRK